MSRKRKNKRTLSLRVFKGKEGYETTAPLWTTLYAKAAEHPFSHPNWSKLLLETDHLWSSFRSLSFFQNGELIALLPILKKGKRLFSLSSKRQGYSDPLIEHGKEQLFLKGLHAFLKASSTRLTLPRMCEPLFPNSIPYIGKTLEYTTIVSLPHRRDTAKTETSLRILTSKESLRHIALLEQWERNREKRQFLYALAHHLDPSWGGIGILSQNGRVEAIAFLLWHRQALFLYWAGGEKKTALSYAMQQWGSRRDYKTLHNLTTLEDCRQRRDLYYTTLYASQK